MKSVVLTTSKLIPAVTLIVIGLNYVHPNDNSQFDYFVFSQHWPITTCGQWKVKSASNTCQFPPLKDIWTIHGLWPSRLNSSHETNFCNKTVKFNPSQLYQLEDQLKIFWINIEKNTPPFSFWKHEWVKHGTCALSVFPDELSYFQAGLGLIDKYDMASILFRGGILPNDTAAYHAQQIGDVVYATLHKRPQLNCVNFKGKHAAYISEVRICFARNLTLIDCPGPTHSNSTYHSNCGDGDVVYLKQVPSAAVTIIWPTIYQRAMPEYATSGAQATTEFWHELYRFVKFLIWLTY